MCGFLNGQQPSENWKSYIIVKAKDVRVTQKKMHIRNRRNEKKKTRNVKKNQK